MPSIVYNSALEESLSGEIDFANDDFKVMLVTSAYIPDKDAHEKRSDISGEVVGAGYVAGGQSVTVTPARDDPTDRYNVALGGSLWAASTITARGAVYYKDNGNPTLDQLVGYIDFTANVISANGNFTLNGSTIRFQN